MPSASELTAKLQASALQPSVLVRPTRPHPSDGWHLCSLRVPAAQEVVDTSDGCGSKFECVIVSATFEGMPLLERQRCVHGVLAEEMPAIHAFSMKTWTPEQHAAKTAAPAAAV
ncbi:hypothetical protein AB1Y20_014746 [Prymnesium parvum]|uniref:BolA-like protein n=1 Tax=Prymnesium parvum TaxID=97485 RepID=A0AB34ID63_PRYPA